MRQRTITRTEIYRLSIPMHPFRIATGTLDSAQNVFIRIHTQEGHFGVGECSAFPMIVGETQSSCFELAREFARIWKGKDPAEMDQRMDELNRCIAFNPTAKSAFDMALHDLAAKEAGLPLYRYLGGSKKDLETDLTIGIGRPEDMARIAVEFKRKGVRIIKVKLGTQGPEDIERVRQIRQAVGPDLHLRLDVNQGWDFETAVHALKAMADYDIDFCEQPMRYWDDGKLPALRKLSPIKLMADESVFDHHDAARLLDSGGCDYVNIKFAKSGGILEATRINAVCASHGIACMMGGMLESRLALTAFAHFALAHENIIFYDMDTCMLGHQVDPIVGGVLYRGYHLQIPDLPGIGADVDARFLEQCDKIIV
jgi:L-Ala-D/L-Glu epimerase